MTIDKNPEQLATIEKLFMHFQFLYTMRLRKRHLNTFVDFFICNLSVVESTTTLTNICYIFLLHLYKKSIHRSIHYSIHSCKQYKEITECMMNLTEQPNNIFICQLAAVCISCFFLVKTLTSFAQFVVVSSHNIIFFP